MDASEDRMGQLEGWLGRLDDRMDGIDTRLRGGGEAGTSNVAGKLDGLIIFVGCLDRRLDGLLSRLPSWWQMPAVIGSTVVTLAALASGFRYLMVHGWLG